jgi:hypothetical protein
MTNTKYTLAYDASVDLGSVRKTLQELQAGESIITYNTEESIFEISEIVSVEIDPDVDYEKYYQGIKMNYLPQVLTLDSIIYVKEELEGETFLGYFTEEAPEIEGVAKEKLVKVKAELHKMFDGVNWVNIDTLELMACQGRLAHITVAKNHSLFTGNLLVSDYKAN